MSATDRPAGVAKREAQRDQGGAERYLRRQREVRRGRDPAGAPGPLEYDENGFPVTRRNSSFVERVTRLLNPL